MHLIHFGLLDWIHKPARQVVLTHTCTTAAFRCETVQVVYEMAAVLALVESIDSAFREGFAAACVIAYESRAHKLEEVRESNI